MPSTNSLRAALILCAGIFVFSFQDMIIKGISADYPVHQAMVIRSLTSVPLLLILVGHAGGLGLLFTRRLKWLALRGVVLTLAYTSYYLALPAMKLANAVALTFTSPLFITLLAALFLGERSRLDRWSAVALGGLGTIIMVQPGAADFDWASLLPLVSALSYAAAQIMARRLGAIEVAPVMTFYQNMMFLIIASLLALFLSEGIEGATHPSVQFLSRAWIMPSIADFLLMVACGVIATAGAVLLTQAYRMAEASFVASFEYTALIWGTMWGFAFWSEVPGVHTIVGAICIIGAGLYMLWSDGRYNRAVTRPEVNAGNGGSRS